MWSICPARILVIAGARPQFIKAAGLWRALDEGSGLELSLCHTGQHYDRALSEQFFEEFSLPEPRYRLGIQGGGHGDMVGRMLIALEPLLAADRPDAVLVFGDTNSTLAGALAAAKLGIPVAHVEAGIRSNFTALAEEVNRRMVDAISTWLFPPTPGAQENLRREGVSEAAMGGVGDIMRDTFEAFAPTPAEREATLRAHGLEAGAYVLASAHRAENTDHPHRLRAIVDGLEALAMNCPVVAPRHPRLAAALGAPGVESRRIRWLEPVGYREMLALQGGARVVVTDSGGTQKEACWSGVPCVFLREETEWPELVEAGWLHLCAPGRDMLQTVVARVEGQPRPPAPSGPGSGRVGRQILARLARDLTQEESP